MSFTKSELTMGREKTYPNEYTKEVSDNLDKLLIAMNIVRHHYGQPMYVSSGWRPGTVNDKVAGAAKASSHVVGLACDIRDENGQLWAWCLNNLQLLKDNGIYLEDRRWCNHWVHFQIRKVPSGKRIFKAFSTPAPYPELFDGKYDIKYDD